MDAPTQPPEYATIRDCLARIRTRLFVVRTAERIAVGLIFAAVIAAAFVLARYLRERYPAYALLVALAPAAVVGLYWGARLRYFPQIARFRSVFCLKFASVLTLALTTLMIALLVTGAAALVPMWGIVAAAAGTFVIAALVQTRVVSPQAAAIFVDQQVGLDEKVSTAFELLHRPPTSDEEARFVEPLVSSAAQACVAVRQAKVGYSRLDRRVYLASAVCMAAAIGVSTLNPLPAIAKASNRRPDPGNAMVAKELSKALEPFLQNKTPEEIKNDPVLGRANDTLQQLLKGEQSRLDRMSEVNKLKTELDKMSERYESSRKAAEQMSKGAETNPLAEAAKRYEDAAKRAANGEQGAAEAKERAAQDIEKEAKAIGDRLAGMSDQEKNDLKAALDKARDAAKGNAGLESALSKAADAVEKGDGSKLGDAMRDAGGQMASNGAEASQNQDKIRDTLRAINEGNRQANAGGAGNPNAGGGSENSPGGEQQAGGGGGEQSGNGGQEGSGQHNNGSNGQNNNGAGSAQGSNGGGNPSPGMTGSSAGKGGDRNGGPEGPGSTNTYNPGKGGGETSTDETGGKGEMVRMYGSSEMATKGHQDKATGNLNKGGPTEGTMDFMGSAEKDKPIEIRYEDARKGAAKRALEQMDRQQIPPSKRDLIRNYFGDTAQPGAR